VYHWTAPDRSFPSSGFRATPLQGFPRVCRSPRRIFTGLRLEGEAESPRDDCEYPIRAHWPTAGRNLTVQTLYITKVDGAHLMIAANEFGSLGEHAQFVCRPRPKRSSLNFGEGKAGILLRNDLGSVPIHEIHNCRCLSTLTFSCCWIGSPVDTPSEFLCLGPCGFDGPFWEFSDPEAALLASTR
jgi:hypothetical protein